MLVGTDYGIEHRIKQMNKRMGKLEGVRATMSAPEVYGPSEADLTILSWGSPQGSIREAIDRTNAKDGPKINALEFYDIHPLPVEKVQPLLDATKKTLGIEINYTGQFLRHLRAETGFKVDTFHRKFDGEHLTPAEVVTAIEGALK